MGTSDMVVSAIIIAVSLTLFVYWFRYTCLLILSAKTSRDYAPQVATANQLNFLDTRDRLLDTPEDASLDALHDALRRDYRLLAYLMKYAAGRSQSVHALENRILMLDYHIMVVWYRIVRPISSERARNALLEMTSIVNHLANAMGERLTFSARA